MKSLAFISSLLLAASAHAQFVGGDYELPEFDAVPTGYGGWAVESLGDVNGDGIADILIGQPEYIHNSTNKLGRALVYSGATQTLLYQIRGEDSSRYAETLANAGDLTGDGVNDFLVGAKAWGPPFSDWRGKAFAYDGTDGTLLWTWEGILRGNKVGRSMARAGDLDNDGIQDVALAFSFRGPNDTGIIGRVRIFSGATGTLIREIIPTDPLPTFGLVMENLGDTNQDGFDDLLVSAPGRIFDHDFIARGSVYLYSGANGALLNQWDSYPYQFGFGQMLQAVDDADGDGVQDFFIGSPVATIGSIGDEGFAGLYSGASGTLIHQWEGRYLLAHLGSSVAMAGDVDGDGFKDYYIGAPGWGSGMRQTGTIELYSGADFKLMREIHGPANQAGFGRAMAHLGDIDGDGYDEILCAHGHHWTDRVPAFLLDFNPFLQGDRWDIQVDVGGILNLTMDFPWAASHYSYKILISSSGTGPSMFGVNVPLSFDALVFETMAGNYSVPIHSNMHGFLDVWGDGTASITLPPNAFSGWPNALHFAAIAFQGNGMPAFSSAAYRVLLR